MDIFSLYVGTFPHVHADQDSCQVTSFLFYMQWSIVHISFHRVIPTLRDFPRTSHKCMDLWTCTYIVNESPNIPVLPYEVGICLCNQA